MGGGAEEKGSTRETGLSLPQRAGLHRDLRREGTGELTHNEAESETINSGQECSGGRGDISGEEMRSGLGQVDFKFPGGLPRGRHLKAVIKVRRVAW